MSYKTLNKRSKSRHKLDPTGIDESLEEIEPVDNNMENQREDSLSIKTIEKPFKKHNAIKNAEVAHLAATNTPNSNQKSQRYTHFDTDLEFNRKELENYNVSYLEKVKSTEKLHDFSANKAIFHSYKSHKNLKNVQ